MRAVHPAVSGRFGHSYDKSGQLLSALIQTTTQPNKQHQQMNLPTKPSEILTSELENLQETIFAFQSRGLQHVAEIHKIELTADVASAMLTYLGGNLRRIRDFFAEVEAANNLPDNEKLDAVKSLISMIVWNAFDIKEQLERTPLDTPAADSN